MADDLTDAAPAAPPPALAPEHQEPEARLWAAIQAWRASHITGGPIARATDCWNHLETSLGGLVQSILKEI
jgi:hypothetical protein